MITKNGMPYHTLATMTEAIAYRGSDRKPMGSARVTRPRRIMMSFSGPYEPL